MTLELTFYLCSHISFIVVWMSYVILIRASSIAQLVKNLPALQMTLVRFLGLEDGEGIGLSPSFCRGEWDTQGSKCSPRVLK